MEFTAFDDYFLGRPKVDRIIYRIISDPNTTLANVLSNEVDVSLDQALSVEGTMVADREWAARGEGAVKFTPLNWTWVNASGTSPLRATVPFLFIGWIASLCVFAVNDRVVPHTSQVYERLRQEAFRGHGTTRVMENVAIMDSFNRLYHARELAMVRMEEEADAPQAQT